MDGTTKSMIGIAILIAICVIFKINPNEFWFGK